MHNGKNYGVAENKKRTPFGANTMRRKMVYWVVTILFGISGLFYECAIAFGVGPNALAEKGNIYYSEDGVNKIQLTKGGADREPVLSPDGSCVAFIRKTKDKKDELWFIKIKGGKSKLLVKEITYPSKGGSEKKPLYRIVTDGIRFSPDGKTIYFVTRDYETDGGIHAIGIHGENQRFIVAGREVKVVERGRYKGDLLLVQHRYFVAGPSYDWVWLYTSSGKEIGPMAEDWDDVDWENLNFEETIVRKK